MEPLSQGAAHSQWSEVSRESGTHYESRYQYQHLDLDDTLSQPPQDESAWYEDEKKNDAEGDR